MAERKLYGMGYFTFPNRTQIRRVSLSISHGEISQPHQKLNLSELTGNEINLTKHVYNSNNVPFNIVHSWYNLVVQKKKY